MSDPDVEEDGPQRASYQLTVDQKINLCVLIARYQAHDNLACGDLTKISQAFGVSDTAVSKFAKRLKAGEPASRIVKSRKKGNTNQFAYNNDKLLAKITKLKPEQRGTMRDIARHIDVSLHKVHDMVHAGLLICNCRNLKPCLSPVHCLAGLEWANSLIDDRGRVNDMMDYVHIDEKWFYVHHDGGKIYVTAEENASKDIEVQHKLHI